MSKARLVLTALLVERQTPAQIAARYGVHRSWVYKLKARYQAEGEAAFEPRSRRPRTSPTAIPAATVTLIIQLRATLTSAGLDAGPDTIAWHLAHRHNLRVSAATISRTLTRAGLVTPQPAKRPKASYQRFQADLPNQCWQADFTHYRPTRPDGSPGPDTEILTWLDDHSRYALSVTAHARVTGPIVHATFCATVARHGTPAATLTDIQAWCASGAWVVRPSDVRIPGSGARPSPLLDRLEPWDFLPVGHGTDGTVAGVVRPGRNPVTTPAEVAVVDPC